jgi:predicted ATPase/class 3 adenylate cyclase
MPRRAQLIRGRRTVSNGQPAEPGRICPSDSDKDAGSLSLVIDLPTGTVTFLFTDIEGSTRLLHELGTEAYDEALTEHRRVLREAFARHGGVEVDTQGDAFFYAFPTAPGALEAAADGQEALSAGPIRVRMGLHTGTPHVGEEGYVGADVHRAARIAAAGHGGQVLLSEAAHTLVDHSALRDLGQHRLKDLSAPERLYQLGEVEFPPLKTLYRANLPVPAASFLGREQELREVGQLLQRSDIRLLTLSGPGGTGKTRLALQAAAESAECFPDGLVWVPLASLRDPGLLFAALAQALGLKEEAQRPLTESVVDHLSGRRQLLLLDNAEHLLPAVATETAQVLQAPAVTLLVTSRERLQLQGEHVWAVPPLDSEDGVALFTARAAALGAPLAASSVVRSLCERLDNLPLALELAAARTTLFSPEQLLERLGQRLDLLKAGRDVDPRQQTLRATIGWSHDLLNEDERRLFRRLAVFVGGCTYEAAEAVCEADPDNLQSLLDKSLLRRGDGAFGPRYWMLETIREYAEEQLDAAEEADALRRRHAEYFLDLAEQAEPEMWGLQQRIWFDRVDSEHDNLRAALAATLAANEPDTATRLAAALEPFWETRGHVSEGWDYLRRVLAAKTGVAKVSRAKALFAADRLAQITSRYHEEKPMLEEAVTLFAEAGEQRGHIFSLSHLGLVLDRLGEPEEARRRHEEAVSLAQALGDRWLLAMALNNLSCTLMEEGDYAAAGPLAEESLTLRRALGEKRGIAISLTTVAELSLAAGDGESAIPLLKESLVIARELGHVQFEAGMTMELGLAELYAGDRERPRLLLEEALARCVELDDMHTAADCLSGLAALAGLAGDVDRAARLFGLPRRCERQRASFPARSSDPSTIGCCPRSRRTPMRRRSQPAGKGASGRAQQRSLPWPTSTHTRSRRDPTRPTPSQVRR